MTKNKLIPKTVPFYRKGGRPIGFETVGASLISGWDKMTDDQKAQYKRQYEHDWKKQDQIYNNKFKINNVDTSIPDLNTNASSFLQPINKINTDNFDVDNSTLNKTWTTNDLTQDELDDLELMNKLNGQGLVEQAKAANPNITDTAALKNFYNSYNLTGDDYNAIESGTYAPKLNYTPNSRKLSNSEVDEVYNYLMTLPQFKNATNLDTNYLKNSIANQNWSQQNLEAVRNGTYDPTITSKTITKNYYRPTTEEEKQAYIDQYNLNLTNALDAAKATQAQLKQRELAANLNNYSGTALNDMVSSLQQQGWNISTSYKVMPTGNGSMRLFEYQTITDPETGESFPITDLLSTVQTWMQEHPISDPSDIPNNEIAAIAFFRGAGAVAKPLYSMYKFIRNMNKAAKDYKFEEPNINQIYENGVQGSAPKPTSEPTAPTQIPSNKANIKRIDIRHWKDKLNHFNKLKRQGLKQVDIRDLSRAGHDTRGATYAFENEVGGYIIFKKGGPINMIDRFRKYRKNKG